MSIEELSTPLLMESFEKARELQLDTDFIQMLTNELVQRDIYFPHHSLYETSCM